VTEKLNIGGVEMGYKKSVKVGMFNNKLLSRVAKGKRKITLVAIG
jgi:hypothetical protein